MDLLCQTSVESGLLHYPKNIFQIRKLQKFLPHRERYFIKNKKKILFSVPNIPVADAVAGGVEQEWSWRVCRLLCFGGKAAAALLRRRSGGKAVAALRRRRSGGVAAAPTEGRRRRRRRRCGGSGRSGWRACSSSYAAPPGPWR
jgi:hypothetical protein